MHDIYYVKPSNILSSNVGNNQLTRVYFYHFNPIDFTVCFNGIVPVFACFSMGNANEGPMHASCGNISLFDCALNHKPILKSKIIEPLRK